MLEVILSFIYIGIFCLCTGTGIMKLLSKKLSVHVLTITGYIVTGIITLTILVGYISLFSKIGPVVHIVLLLMAAALGYYSKTELSGLISSYRAKLKPADIIFMCLLVLGIAFFASRGDFHTDTGIYHAANIRLYEEYGIIKGMANIQQHYGYNSSYLGFAALFTLSGILPNALHATTGFFMALAVLDAFVHLKDFGHHSHHYSDMMRIANILYVFMNLTGAMSPATDYGTMIMTGLFLCACLETAEKEMSAGALGAYTDMYALLSVYGLYLVTMKFSSAMCVLIAIIPVIRYIRQKKYLHIPGFLAFGFFSFLYFPIRNVIISGWLFYPFESIDLFNVRWKVPVEYSLVDSAQIKVWGKCLFDIEKADYTIRQWFPIWWEAQEHYDQMMIYAVFVSMLLLIITALIKRKFSSGLLVFYIIIMLNLLIWFVNAPFIRYGLIFLIAAVLVPIGGYLSITPKGFTKYLSFCLCLLIIVSMGSRIDHYLTDDLVFVKHNLSDPYYIAQKPFDDPQMKVVYPGDAGIPVYVCDNDKEKNSYYTPPSTCYEHMILRTVPMGDTVKDGFMPAQ